MKLTRTAPKNRHRGGSTEIARVLAPGGIYFAQHVGGGTNVEMSEYFLGPLDPGNRRDHDVEAAQAEVSGLEIVQCRNERLGLEFFDVGAMVYFLRKVVWTVPGFSVDRYRARLKNLHDENPRRATREVIFERIECWYRPRRRYNGLFSDHQATRQ